MNDHTTSSNRRGSAHGPVATLGLAVAMMAGLFATSGFAPIHAQATSGSIFGEAPAGREVVVQSTSGVKRHATVKSSGHYRIGSLPLGVYNAVLVEKGQEVDMHSNIQLTVGASAKVDFVCAPEGCGASASGKSNQ